MPFFNYHSKRIFANSSGKGKTIVLLHGFTESSEIWKRMTTGLSENFKVIVIDLPGHGESDCVEKVHDMELQADVVHAVLSALKVRKCLMIGHSMGGYVTLAFAREHPEMLGGFGLFHSHVFADSHEEKENRDRAIELVKNDKTGFITRFIPGLFPPEVQRKFAKEIRELVRQAGKMPKEGIIAAQAGMKVRKDQTALLRTTRLPVLFILGLKDIRVPVDKIRNMIFLPVRSEALILRDVGHMGYIEAPGETLEAIRGFAGKVLLKTK